jgi:DNA-nicking Smr family endonuclease
MAEKALFETPYPIAADEVEKARYSPLRRGAYKGVYGSLVLFGGEEAREELARLLTRAERTQDPKLADAYLEKRPKAK